ncbi:C2 domain protein [Dictyocaulus viviparus]|uniref:C2 domain protein n=1 Tax=Dictyocaulus viviparus TaxID=29172 RepID=A0A0D8XLF3_DICVI|nr:C2 domain protein [Dictyocaulus viviparus]
MFSKRFEVPGELRPKFQNFAVQILCWGLRNLKKYQFLSIRQPFLELIIGDMETRTDPIPNVAKDPNFETPLITFPQVSLPSELEFSPPLVINLYDTRAFKRQPLVGVCHITNFDKYTRCASKKKEASTSTDWAQFDKTVDKENEELLATPLIPSLRKEGMPKIDWWSKYYASAGYLRKSARISGIEQIISSRSGMEYMKIFDEPLEYVNGYNGFEDFLDTFTFMKSSKGNFDDPEEKEKTGELKGKVYITRTTDKEELLEPPGVEFLGTVKCLLRVYVVEARGLVSMRKNGMCDPYIIVRCGKQKMNLKKNYRPDTVEPIFGERVEMEVTIPVEKDLVITVMDRRKLIADDEIGSTRIDLENRLLSKWRATVGLSKQYTIQGELKWRDQQTPLATLRGYCKKMRVPAPCIIEKGDDVGIKMLGIEIWHSQVKKDMDESDRIGSIRLVAGKDKDASNTEEKDTEEKQNSDTIDESANLWIRTDENKARLASIAQHGERVKDMKLTNDDRQKIRRMAREEILGRPLQQVALYVLKKLTYGAVPPPLDITPREPEKYQLRIALFNVFGAIPVKRSFGTPVSDLYVKVFMNGAQKRQKSDVHFRSLDGCGEFNWRFVIDISYNPWEQKIVNYNKKRFLRKASEEMVDPLVIIQLWDKNKFRKDVMLGEMVMDMTHFREGIDDPDEVGIIRKRSRADRCRLCARRNCCVRLCIFCKETRCCCKTRRTVKVPFPKPMKYKIPEEEIETVNLFDSSNLKGWWPVLNTKLNQHNEQDDTAEKKKDDDYKSDQLYIMGLLQMEMSLLTAAEAIADPVGKKRKEPNHSPYLPKPIRSTWNVFWITSRIRPCVCWLWQKCLVQFLCYIIMGVLFVFLLYGLLSNWPVLLVLHEK